MSEQEQISAITFSFSFATILPLEPKCFGFPKASCRVNKENVGRSLAGIVVVVTYGNLVTTFTSSKNYSLVVFQPRSQSDPTTKQSEDLSKMFNR